MSNDNRSIVTLHDLLDYDAKNFTVGEILLKKVLPEWINQAGNFKLKVVLQKYNDLVHQHVQKMEGFIDAEKITSLSITNKVIKSLIDETEEKIGNCSDAEVKDACLLACIQTINHFKISAYGTAAAFAGVLGMDKSAAIFHEAEVNEKQIDDRLSQLAKFEINVNAQTTIELPQ